MTTHGRSTVVGVFRTRERAKDAIDSLKDAGFSSQDIGILMQDKGETQGMAQETGTNVGTGAATGAIGGGMATGMGTTDSYDTTQGEMTGTRRWDDVSSEYSTHWQQQHGSSGGRWEDYEPSYRYGYEMSMSPRYRGRSFSDVEPELRRDWETQHRDKPWDRFADSIRDAWEGVTHQDKAA
jgi:hypothetical protein